MPAGRERQVDFVELFNPRNFTAKSYDLTAGLVIDMSVDQEKDLRVEAYRAQAQHDMGRQDPMVVIGAPPCTVFSAMQKHQSEIPQHPRMGKGMTLLQFAVDVYWDQISRGKFFLHEHPATAASWDCQSVRDLAEHTGVIVVTGNMCKWGMHVTEEKENQGTDRAVLVKKPTKWMTNSSVSANTLSAGCAGGHEHSKLEGSNRTQQAATIPSALVQGVLNACRRMKKRRSDANHARPSTLHDS